MRLGDMSLAGLQSQHAASSSADRQPLGWCGGLPVVEVIGKSGRRAPYLGGMASALRTFWAKPVLSIGASGGAIPAAFLQAGADEATLLRLMAEVPTESLRTRADMELWTGKVLAGLGVRTWADMRFGPGEAHPGLEGWTHRLNFQVTAFDVPPRLVNSLLDRKDRLTPRDFWSTVANCYRLGEAPKFRQYCLPQDAPEWMDIDSKTVASTLSETCAHPVPYGPGLHIRPDGWGVMHTDGAFHLAASPFARTAHLGLPVVEMEIGDDGADRRRVRDLLRLARTQGRVGALRAVGMWEDENAAAVHLLTPQLQRDMFEAGREAGMKIFIERFFDHAADTALASLDHVGTPRGERSERVAGGARIAVTHLNNSKAWLASAATRQVTSAVRTATQVAQRPVARRRAREVSPTNLSRTIGVI